MSDSVREEVVKALETCYDPEVPVNIVDLGLIYDLDVKDGEVSVKMALTTPECPMRAYIVDQVRLAVMRVKDVKYVDVEVVSEPPWTPDRISEEGKKALSL